MNRVELFLTELYNFCVRNNYAITKDELYSYINKVDDFNSYDETLFYDICDYPEIYLQSYQEARELKGLDNDIHYYFSNSSNYKRIEVWYDNRAKTGIRDNIKLYFPFQNDDLVKNSKLIFKFLFDEKIAFIAKISKTKRLDGFIIRLFHKDDAIKLLDYSENLTNFLELNPFIPTINKVGIGRDTYGESYHYHLCKILSEYANTCMKNINNEIFTKDHFIKYLSTKLSSNLTKKEDFMNLCVIRGVNCVLNNTNILDTFPNSYNIKYENLNYEYDESTRSFICEGLYVTPNNDLNLYITLNTNRLLKILYESKYGQAKEYVLGENISSYISYMIDKLNDAGEDIKIKCDDDIKKLLPYLYAYFCINIRHFDSYKAIEIIRLLK